jgi:hypothetical protein
MPSKTVGRKPAQASAGTITAILSKGDQTFISDKKRTRAAS